MSTNPRALKTEQSLPTRRLGTTDMHITRVGLGAWAIGGPDGAAAWGTQDDNQSVAAIRYAVECGINWIDTAAIYGLGHSEEIVRRALKDIPPSRRPYVFTKGGLGNLHRRRAQALPQDDWRSRSSDFTGAGLARNLALAQALKPIAARR